MSTVRRCVARTGRTGLFRLSLHEKVSPLLNGRSYGFVLVQQFSWPFECEETEQLENMTLDEIFNGTPLTPDGSAPGFAFPGLIPLVKAYLGALQKDSSNSQTSTKINNYLDFIAAKARVAMRTKSPFAQGQHHRFSFVLTSVVFLVVYFSTRMNCGPLQDGCASLFRIIRRIKGTLE